MEIAFFFVFDNMNFYKHKKDQHLHNKGHQVAYTIRYVCFIYSNNNNQIEGN